MTETGGTTGQAAFSSHTWLIARAYSISFVFAGKGSPPTSNPELGVSAQLEPGRPDDCTNRPLTGASPTTVVTD